jgi:hypothetical protein
MGLFMTDLTKRRQKLSSTQRITFYEGNTVLAYIEHQKNLTSKN